MQFQSLLFKQTAIVIFKDIEDFVLRLIEYLHDSIKPVCYGFLQESVTTGHWKD